MHTGSTSSRKSLFNHFAKKGGCVLNKFLCGLFKCCATACLPWTQTSPNLLSTQFTELLIKDYDHPKTRVEWVFLPVQPCVVCRVRFYGFGTKTWPTSPEHCSSSQPAPCSMHWAEAVHPAYRPAWGRFWAGLAQKHAAGSAEVRSVDKAHVRVIAFLLFRWNSIWAVGSKHKTTHYHKTRNNIVKTIRFLFINKPLMIF